MGRMSSFLADLGLAHLSPILPAESLLAHAQLCSADRLAFLRRMKAIGVTSLRERQQLANALMRALRAGALSAATPATSSPAATAPERRAIAFLFLTYSGLPHEALWRSFLDAADPELHGVFLHQKVEQRLRHFAGCTIPTVPTAYGTFSIVDAELQLLRAAMEDPRCFYKFVFCCGASVPLKPFAHVHHALTCDDCAHFAEFEEPAWALRRGLPSYAGRLV